MHRVVPVLTALILSTSSAQAAASSCFSFCLNNANNPRHDRLQRLQNRLPPSSLVTAAFKLQTRPEEALRGSWRSVETSGAPAWAITFDQDGRLTGTLDCILLFGLFSLQSGTLNIGPLVTTSAACSSDAVMSPARQMADQLLGISHYLVEPNTLTLVTTGGQTVRLVRSAN